MCREGKDCQEGGCQYGHPREWRCKVCVKCGGEGGGEGEGLTGAGVLLMSPSHEEGRYDIVLVEEKNWDADGGREWGEMGGRINPVKEEEDEDEGGREGRREEAPVLAARELLEETAGTVQVSPDTIAACPYVDIGLFHRYRCYLLILGKAEVSVGVYQQARKKAGLPRSWRETLDMRRFPLDRVGEEMRMTRRGERGEDEEEDRRTGEGGRKRKGEEQGESEVEEEQQDEEGMGGEGVGHESKEEEEEEEEEEHGLLMGDLIYSHKGKGHPLAGRVREVLSEIYRAGMLNPYLSLDPSPAAGAADASSLPIPMLARGGGRGRGGRRGGGRGRGEGGRGRGGGRAWV